MGSLLASLHGDSEGKCKFLRCADTAVNPVGRGASRFRAGGGIRASRVGNRRSNRREGEEWWGEVGVRGVEVVAVRMNPRGLMWENRSVGVEEWETVAEDDRRKRGMERSSSSSSPPPPPSRWTSAVVAGILVCVAVGTGCRACTVDKITFAGEGGSLELSGVIYRPRGYDVATPGRYAAVVMMHGCSGIWSERTVNNTNPDGTPNLQKNIEKWGIKLAESNVVALAVDSFTPRQPADVTSSEEWQNQCSDNAGRYAGVVNPYTDRVLDARAAWEYLNALPEINSARIGLLGWSHGAQSVMVEVAETGRDIDVPRDVSDHKFVCAVAFYPGCGENLGFTSDSVYKSFWRPFLPLQLHMGTCDPFYSNCVVRKDLALKRYYSRNVLFSEYPGARHHFDAFSQSWPTSSSCSSNFREAAHHDICSSSLSSADERAMQCADIAALNFFLSWLTVAGHSRG